MISCVLALCLICISVSLHSASITDIRAAPMMHLVTSLCHCVAFQAFHLAEITTVVILICGCCPGGAASNILALALNGDMNLRYTQTHTDCTTNLKQNETKHK